MPFAYIQFLDRNGRPQRPTDPDYGIDEPVDPGYGVPGGRPPHVGNRPPGSWPGRPDQGPVRPGRPVDPGWGIDEGGRPDQGLPGRPPHVGGGPAWPERPVDPGWGRPGFSPGHPGHLPARPGRPVDPDWGVDEGHIPAWPVDPSHPIAPPQPGEPELPPVDPPPGTVWPPLPPSVPAGKTLVLVLISGVGYRYAVLDIPVHPDQGLPNEPPTTEPPELPDGEHPDQGLPGGGARPPHVGNRPPGSVTPPVRPGQPLPRPPIGAGQPTQPIAPGTPPATPKR